jgi:hypothetical protein
MAERMAEAARAALEAETPPPPAPVEPRAPKPQTPERIRAAVRAQSPPPGVDAKVWARASRSASAPSSLSREQLRSTEPSDECLRRLRAPRPLDTNVFSGLRPGPRQLPPWK